MGKKDFYIYPAILTYEEGKEIAVTFPDLPGCVTSGANEEEAFACGREALGLHLFGMERDGDEIPEPSKAGDLATDINEVIAMIEVDMPAVRMSQKNKSVKRTVTLPADLNAKARECGVDLSQVLQEALKAKLQKEEK